MADLLDDFAEYMHSERSSSNSTVQAYMRDIKQYMDYAKDNLVDVTKATRQNVLSYVMYLERSGKAPSSVTRAVAGIRMFYKYLFKARKNEGQPCLQIKTSQVRQKTPRYSHGGGG